MANYKTKNKDDSGVKKTLTIIERNSIDEMIEQKQKMLNATDEYTEGAVVVVAPQEASINKEKLRSDIQKLKKTIDENSPKPAADKERDKLNEERNRLKEFLRDNVLETREEINVANNQHPAWIGAMKKAQMRPRYENMITKYRELCKRLEPDDPYAGSLDAIRKDK